MAKRDLYHNIELASVAVPVAAHAASITLGSSMTIDTYGYHAVVLDVLVGTITDSTHALTLYEADTDSTGSYTAVAAGDMFGSFPANLTSNTNVKVGYIGQKRYLRVALVWTTSGSGVGGVYGVQALLGFPMHKPAPNP